MKHQSGDKSLLLKPLRVFLLEFVAAGFGGSGGYQQHPCRSRDPEPEWVALGWASVSQSVYDTSWIACWDLVHCDVRCIAIMFRSAHLLLLPHDSTHLSCMCIQCESPACKLRGDEMESTQQTSTDSTVPIAFGMSPGCAWVSRVGSAGSRVLTAIGGCDDVFGRAETQPTARISV